MSILAQVKSSHISNVSQALSVVQGVQVCRFRPFGIMMISLDFSFTPITVFCISLCFQNQGTVSVSRHANAFHHASFLKTTVTLMSNIPTR